MQETIYYSFKKNYWWLTLNLLLLALLGWCLIQNPAFIVWWQYQLLVLVAIIWLFLWIYKYLMSIPMAVYDDKTIKIDHNNPIAWKDIKCAEERLVDCCGKKRKVIILVPKDGIEYDYNWLQKNNCGFTAFSLPLYGILTTDDEEKIRNVVACKVGLKRLEEN